MDFLKVVSKTCFFGAESPIIRKLNLDLETVHYSPEKKLQVCICTCGEPVWKVVWLWAGCDYGLGDLMVANHHCKPLGKLYLCVHNGLTFVLLTRSWGY